MHLLPSVAKQPNLELKTWPKQLLGSLLLVIALPGVTYCPRLQASRRFYVWGLQLKRTGFLDRTLSIRAVAFSRTGPKITIVNNLLKKWSALSVCLWRIFSCYSHLHSYMRMHIQSKADTCTHTHTRTCRHIHMRTHTHTHTPGSATHMCARMHIHHNAHQTHHTHMHARTHTHAHTSQSTPCTLSTFTHNMRSTPTHIPHPTHLHIYMHMNIRTHTHNQTPTHTHTHRHKNTHTNRHTHTCPRTAHITSIKKLRRKKVL